MFETTECFRSDQSTCLDSSSPYYQATRHGLDVMVGRLAAEATLMSLSNTSIVGPNSVGWVTRCHHRMLQCEHQMCWDRPRLLVSRKAPTVTGTTELAEAVLP